jgi:hypothetical protein
MGRCFFIFQAASWKRKVILKFLLASFKTITNSKDCSESRNKISVPYFLRNQGRGQRSCPSIMGNTQSIDEETINKQNPKCRLYWCLIKFIDWRYSQSCWYFRPLLWTVAPLPSLWPSPPPSQSKRTTYTSIQCVLWVVLGVLSCVVDHILQKFNTLFLTRFGTCKIATPAQTKTPVRTTFRDWCLYSSFVHGPVHSRADSIKDHRGTKLVFKPV